MRALPVRQHLVEPRIPLRWPPPQVLMLVPPEVPLTRVQARLLRLQVIRRRLLPVLTRVRRVRTQPSPLQARRVLLPVLMRVLLELLELRVRTPDSPVIRVRQERFLERVLSVVRRVRPGAVRVAVPPNSKQALRRTRC